MGRKLGLAGCSCHHSQVFELEPFSLMPPGAEGMVCKPQVQLDFSRTFPAQQTKSSRGDGFCSISIRKELWEAAPQARAYIPEGRSGFQQECPGCATNTQLSLAFSKSPLEIPDCCPACLTRTWLLSENGNSCGEGRQEELCTNNHTPSGCLSPALRWGLNCQSLRKRKTQAPVWWGRGGPLQ